MAELKTDALDNQIENFKYASWFIKIIFILIGFIIFIFSKYAFIFFSTAMLPSIAIIFMDKAAHKCASATLCTFNIMGASPYLKQLWVAADMNEAAKNIIADPLAWLVIFSTVFVGFMIYMALPTIIGQIYVAKANIKIKSLVEHRNRICSDWDIRIEEPSNKSNAENSAFR